LSRYFGINQCKDRAYGLAAALSYWVFKCRDRRSSPAMGTKTWTYRSDRLMKCLEGWEPLEAAIESQRGTRQLQLISHTAHAAS